MIGTLDIKVNAAHPNMPLSPVYTFLGSPQQVRIINVPKQVGNWKITAVQVTVNYPDNSSPSVEATLVGGCWSATLPAPSAVGQSLMGFKVTASGVDEHNDPITGYVLGKGDAYVLDDDATITVGGTTYYVHMLDAVPESPHKGDLAVIDNIYQLYNGSRWHPLGNQATISWSDITGKPDTFPPEAHTHVKSEITDFPETMPPTAHSHAGDNWFTSALEAVKSWASGAFAAITHSHASDSWFTTALGGKINKTYGTATDLTVIEPLTIQASTGGNSAMFSVGTDDGVLYISGPSDLNVTGSTRTLNQIDDKLNELDDGKANASDFSTSTPASYVTDFVQKSVRYQKVTPSNTALAEACINVLTTAGQTYTLPTLATGESRVRDLLLYVNTSATAFAINFPTGTQLLGDNPSITEAGEYIITMTAMPSGKWYVRKIKMEVAQ